MKKGKLLRFDYRKEFNVQLIGQSRPFNRNDQSDGPNHASLWEYIRIFPVIVRSAQSVKMRPLQIERSFIEMLEAVDPKEAEVICLAKDKAIESEYRINLDIVKSAFPVLNIENNSKEPVVEKTKEEQAAEYIELAKLRKAEAKKLYDEAKELISAAEELTNENA